MKRLAYIFLALAIGFASCVKEEFKPEDVDPVVDAAQMGAKSNSHVSSLTFDWYTVHGVHQYGYALVNTEDGTTVAKGITRDNSMTFTGLAASTTYELTVQAFSVNGGVKRQFTFTATTDDIIPLEAPEGLANAIVAGSISFTWQPVDNADYYKYTVLDSEGKEVETGTVTSSSLLLSGYALGTYVLTVQACSDAEEFSNSLEVSYEFTIERKVIRTKKGTYERYDSNDELLSSDTRTLEIYDDGTWSIKAFYGSEGYDFEFSPKDDGTFDILNSYYSGGGYHYVSTGVTDPTSYVAIYMSSDYVEFVQNDPDYGSYLGFYYLDSDNVWGNYDMFSWDVPTEEEPVIKTGTYEHYVIEGSDYILVSTEERVWEVTEDGVYTIKSFMGVEGYDFTFTLKDDGTFDMPGVETSSGYKTIYTGRGDNPTTMMLYWANGYYEAVLGDEEYGNYISFCYYDELSNWCYDIFTWEDVSDAGANEPWSAAGRISGMNGVVDDLRVTIEHDGSGTYTLKNFAGNSGYDLVFSVNASGTLHFLNGKSYNAYQIVNTSADEDEYFYQDKYSSFDGKASGGTIKFRGSFYGNWTFTW